jgi:elongation factor 2
MPRFRQIPQIQELMSQKQCIRNMGIIAHIDHGKTTLADSLLAGAGLLSPMMAGSARVLDYLEEEQKRKITIKTANISLLYKAAEDAYVINLVDTPGHVDFTGKVTRALRAIDGVVVVVDAVEEIMAQTEILTRQALEERVRPVLFINKVDRLITELQLSAEQIEKKLNHIIGSFNDLIELHGEPEFRARWKVDPAKDSVVFGSALHGWGFTLGMTKRKGVKFMDIIHAYKKGSFEELQKVLPVYEAVFELAAKNMPNPKEAQAYRVEKIWRGNVASDGGKAMAECSDGGPAVFCVTNVQRVQEGTVATGRLFSGTLQAGDRLFLVNAQAEVPVEEVSVCMGSFREPVERISAGNVAAVVLPEAVKAGETLVDAAHKEGVVAFESIRYVSEPVVTVALETKHPKDLPVLLEAMDKLAAEDPNLSVAVSRETGEYLLSGMGELHVEVALNDLKKAVSAVEVVSSPPRVVYRETATKKGIAATARSPNRQNKFTVQVQPLERELTALVDEDKDLDSVGNVLMVDAYRNVLVDYSGKQHTPEVLEFICAGFEFACSAGPLCGEPMRHVRVELLSADLDGDGEARNSVEVMHGVGKAVFGSFLTAEPVLLEPVYRMVVSAPSELAGECSRILNRKRGKIASFEQKGALTVVVGFVPVAETLGLSKELRSATSGRAFWQSVLERWERVPEKLAGQLIAEVRSKKGLPAAVPEAVRFLEEEK